MKESRFNVLSDDDISDEEYEELHNPFNDNVEVFIKKYIVHEVVAFSIANAYYRGALCKASFLVHYNSFNDVLNVFPDFEDVKSAIIETLNIKYNLQVVCEEPLTLEQYQ